MGRCSVMIATYNNYTLANPISLRGEKKGDELCRIRENVLKKRLRYTVKNTESHEFAKVAIPWPLDNMVAATGIEPVTQGL